LNTAENQNREVIFKTGCNSSADIAACLRSIPTDVMFASAPDSWNDQDFWPIDPSGLDQGALVIVDGYTLNTSLLKALAIPINDVPVIFTSVRDEDNLWAMDLLNVTNLNVTGYTQYLQEHFAPWSNDTGTKLANFYMPTTLQSVNQSYFDLRVDVGIFLCE